MSKTPCFPKNTAHLWAKSPAPGQASGQTLTEHTWQVLERLRDLATLRPNLPQQIGQPRLWQILFWAAFLHDFGKIAAGFQAVLRSKARRWPYRHEVLSLAFLPWLAEDFSATEQIFLAATIVTHHKDLSDLDEYLRPFSLEDDSLPLMLGELNASDVAALHTWLTGCAADWLKTLQMESLGVCLPVFASAHTLADVPQIRRQLQNVEDLHKHWRESLYQSADPLALSALLRPGIFLRGLMVQSDHLASSGFGAPPALKLSGRGILDAVHISVASLRPHQQESAQVTGHALLSAPTGSGKTEAALLWATQQHPARLFYTLPYQASMNAMFDRLNEIFPEQVGLLHGRATLSLYQRLMEQNYNPQDAAKTARELRNRAGLSYYPVRVFSPYQMLKAAFQLKGYEALLTDFYNAAFIFDEIHAYEPRRLALILETVRFLRQHYAVRFFFMSATLPKPVREALAEALEDFTSIQANAQTYALFKRHRLHLLEGDLLEDASLERILQAVKGGAQALVVCNTVARAQQVWQTLGQRLPADVPRFLLHGRFCGRDRAQKERQILAAAGLNQTGRRPLLVVATQVVEVSLNLDLDILFSDPAPLEALLQRFGRINRLGKRPPAPVCVFTQIQPVYKHIYNPIRQVERTLEILRNASADASADGLIIDEAQLPAWLDDVYDEPELLQAWRETYDQQAREFCANFLGKLLPFQSDPAIEREFNRLFDGLEVLPECFYEEYLALKDSENALQADHLLVAVSMGQYHALAGKGLLKPGDKTLPPIARSEYTSEMGLTFEKKIQADDWD